MTKSRRHSFVITVSFDRACGSQHAIAAVRDCIHGEHFPCSFSDEQPEIMKVRSFKPLPRQSRRA
jgi:hypothetical protein